MRTMGRLINWAKRDSNECNLAATHFHFLQRYMKGVLFYATQDIPPFTQLRWDYGDPESKKTWQDGVIPGVIPDS